MRFGRKLPHPHRPLRMLARYLSKPLPEAPQVVDYYTGVAPLSDVLANDRLGDCTSAGMMHIIESINYQAGNALTLSADDAIKFYSLSTGYNPADPSTDQGGVESDVLTYAQQHGIDGNGLHKITAFVDVDCTNPQELKSALWLFGNLYFGICLPSAWTSSFPTTDGFVWDVAEPNYNQGHCFVGVGANEQGIIIDTWGLRGLLTWAAIAKLCSAQAQGNVFALLTEELIVQATQKTSEGIDFGTLKADFDSIGGHV